MESDLRRRPMRLAAGGFLALASLFNLFVALGFMVGGVFAVQLGGLLGADAEGFRANELAETVGGPFVLGQILLVCAGIVFIGAVSVLASLYPRVIYVACAVAILAALFGAFITTFGLPHAVGIVGGGLGFISGLRIQFTASEPGATAPSPGVSPRGLWDWMAAGCLVGGLAMLVVAAYVWFN